MYNAALRYTIKQVSIMERHCQYCNCVIKNCNGFVHAGDFLLLLLGKLDRMPRETCGRCDLKRDPELWSGQTFVQSAPTTDGT